MDGLFTQLQESSSQKSVGSFRKSKKASKHPNSSQQCANILKLKSSEVSLKLKSLESQPKKRQRNHETTRRSQDMPRNCRALPRTSIDPNTKKQLPRCTSRVPFFTFLLKGSAALGVSICRTRCAANARGLVKPTTNDARWYQESLCGRV